MFVLFSVCSLVLLKTGIHSTGLGLAELILRVNPCVCVCVCVRERDRERERERWVNYLDEIMILESHLYLLNA